MFSTYSVHYSEYDFVKNSFDQEYLLPMEVFPKKGEFVIMRSGMFEVDSIESNFSNWQVHLVPITTQCKKNDIVCVKDKDVIYKCVQETSGCEIERFEKVSMLNVLTDVDAVKDKLDRIERT